MADARITIEGAVASEPRYGTTQNGTPVGNLRVLAGRSRKNDDGSWETLSTTAYDVSFWQSHAELMSSMQPEKGSKVIVTGTVTGLEAYDGKNGTSLSAKVSGDGLRVFPKRDQQGGYQTQQQGQPAYSQNQQHQGWGQNPNQQGDPWSAPQDATAPF